MNYELLLGPLLGGAIGYITNDIAIRMMFRPHQPKYVFGMRIPFTPGIIPKERGRIAEAVGNSISENLINREVLEKNLLSPEMMSKIGGGYDRFVARQKVNGESLRSLLCHYLPAKDLRTIQDDSSTELATLIHNRLADSDMGDRLAHAAVTHAIGKMENSLLGIAFNADQFVRLLAEPAEHLLAKHINQIISTNSEEIIRNLVSREGDTLLDTPVCQLLQGHDEQLAQLRHLLLDGYSNIITTHLPKILSTIDISRIVRDRINDMDMDEAEGIILAVVSKELRAIVWLGALLGAIIGTVNSFF